MTKISIAVLLAAGSLLASSAAFAVSTDDVKWINRCIRDSAGMDASADVKLKYCTCMVNKMDDAETLSVTAWERTHTAEARACDRESGWK
jgi:hypothetical protein